jgi:hypothetical protein
MRVCDASDGGALQEQTWVLEALRVGGLSCMMVHGAGVIKQ